MTKQDLVRMLEPFDDKTEVILHRDGYDFCPNMYYSWDNRYDSAVVILATTKPNREKTVEIK